MASKDCKHWTPREAPLADDLALASSLAKALRAVYPAGSWCPYCGQDIDSTTATGCSTCRPARAALSAWTAAHPEER